MIECKSALVAESGDIEKALDWLRKKGVAVAGKKAGRTTAQGLVAATVNASGDAGALVEVRVTLAGARALRGSAVLPQRPTNAPFSSARAPLRLSPAACRSTARLISSRATPFSNL